MSNVLISSDAIWSYVLGPPEVDALLYNLLKFHPAGYDHVWSYQNDRWDGFNRLYSITNKRFRRGLLHRVIKYLEGAGYVVSTFQQPLIDFHTDEYAFKLKSFTPFDFQNKIVESACNNNIGIVASSTGSGKTACIALTIDKLRLRTMVLVTDIVLLDQMQQSLSRYFDKDVGMIGDGEFELRDVTVSTTQSLLSILTKAKADPDKRKALVDHLKSISMVIADECQLFDNDSVAEIMPYCTATSRFLSVSATPYGWGDKIELVENLELEQHFGHVIHDTRSLDFVKIGIRVPLIVNSIKREPLNEKYNKHTKNMGRGRIMPDHTKNYREALDTEVLKNPYYSDLIASNAAALELRGDSVFIHASHSIKFGEEICNKIPGAVLVNGKTPRLERRRIYDEIRNKNIRIIVSDVGGAGLDIPSLNAMIIASDLKDVRQLVGRVIRKSPGKDFGLVVDIKTKCSYLGTHAKIRKSQYEAEHAIISQE